MLDDADDEACSTDELLAATVASVEDDRAVVADVTALAAVVVLLLAWRFAMGTWNFSNSPRISLEFSSEDSEDCSPSTTPC